MAKTRKSSKNVKSSNRPNTRALSQERRQVVESKPKVIPIEETISKKTKPVRVKKVQIEQPVSAKRLAVRKTSTVDTDPVSKDVKFDPLIAGVISLGLVAVALSAWFAPLFIQFNH